MKLSLATQRTVEEEWFSYHENDFYKINYSTCRNFRHLLLILIIIKCKLQTVYGRVWFLVENGLWSSMVCGREWSMVEYGLSSNMVCGREWSMVEYGLWSNMVCGRVWSVVEHTSLLMSHNYTDIFH